MNERQDALATKRSFGWSGVQRSSRPARRISRRLGQVRSKLLSIALIGVVLVTACGDDAKPLDLPQSIAVDQAGDSVRLTLTQEAADRLKVTVEAIQERAITLKRSGEVLYLPELGGQVNANDNGIVLAAVNGQLPKTGDAVSAGQVLLRVAPFNGGPPIDVTSPRNGTFIRLRAGPGQTVAPGQAMFEIADLSRVWVWVPISSMDLSRVVTDRPVTVKPLTPGGTALQAQPVAPPPTLAGLALFFSVDAVNHGLAPGQRLEVELSELATSRRVMPYSAVVYDSNGASWVYASTETNVFERKSVTVDLIEGGLAVISAGPEAGTNVATVGAAELYASEAGVGRPASPTEALQK